MSATSLAGLRSPSTPADRVGLVLLIRDARGLGVGRLVGYGVDGRAGDGRCLLRQRVGVDGDEQRRVRAPRDRHALVERHERVVGACHHDPESACDWPRAWPPSARANSSTTILLIDAADAPRARRRCRRGRRRRRSRGADIRADLRVPTTGAGCGLRTWVRDGVAARFAEGRAIGADEFDHEPRAAALARLAADGAAFGHARGRRKIDDDARLAGREQPESERRYTARPNATGLRAAWPVRRRRRGPGRPARGRPTGSMRNSTSGRSMMTRSGSARTKARRPSPRDRGRRSGARPRGVGSSRAAKACACACGV